MPDNQLNKYSPTFIHFVFPNQCCLRKGFLKKTPSTPHFLVQMPWDCPRISHNLAANSASEEEKNFPQEISNPLAKARLSPSPSGRPWGLDVERGWGEAMWNAMKLHSIFVNHTTLAPNIQKAINSGWNSFQYQRIFKPEKPETAAIPKGCNDGNCN